MIKDVVESLYYMFTGHDDDTDDPVPYREKVQGVLAWIGVTTFCIIMLSLFSR
jgi:hypothetical protein